MKLLQDRLSDGQGNDSIPLTEEDAKRLAKLAKQGNVTPSDTGITLNGVISSYDVLHQSVQAGIDAALISIVIRIAPELYKIFSKLVIEHKIDWNDLQNIGEKAVKGIPQDFIRGSITAALLTAIKSGYGGAFLQNNVNPSMRLQTLRKVLPIEGVVGFLFPLWKNTNKLKRCL